MSTKLGPRFNDFVLSLVTLEHRFDPYFRDAFNAVFQRPIVAVTQLLLRTLRKNRETRLCEEIPVPGLHLPARPELRHQLAEAVEKALKGQTHH